MRGCQPKGPRFESGQQIVGLQKKAGKEKKKKADDSHHPEAKQTGYNQT